MTATDTVTANLLDLIGWYAAEAAMLDERRFDEWLDLLTEDIRYQIPIRRNVAPAHNEDFDHWTVDAELGAGDDLLFVDNDLAGLRGRIDRLRTGTAWAERPASRVTRLIGLPLVTGEPAPEQLAVRTPFVLHKTRVESEDATLSGFRRDLLLRVEGSYRLAHRVVILNAAVLPSHNLSVII